MGPWPAGDRSMIDSRLCPRPTTPDGSTYEPVSSGPRWASAPTMASILARSKPGPAMPEIPHMTSAPPSGSLPFQHDGLDHLEVQLVVHAHRAFRRHDVGTDHVSPDRAPLHQHVPPGQIDGAVSHVGRRMVVLPPGALPFLHAVREEPAALDPLHQ